MTIGQALSTLTPYPVPDLTISKITVDRDLLISETYTKSIGESQLFELATADLYSWVGTAHNISEQGISISLPQDIKNEYMTKANAIYQKYSDSKFSGRTYGFKGESYV